MTISSSYVLTFGPMYVLYRYLDPLGLPPGGACTADVGAGPQEGPRETAITCVGRVLCTYRGFQIWR